MKYTKLLFSVVAFVYLLFLANMVMAQSNDELYQKAEWLRKTASLGAAEDIEQIIPLLADERLNTAARTSLMNLGEPGKIALRESLDTLDGRNRAGVIGSLGTLKDEESVDKIAEILKQVSQEILVASVDFDDAIDYSSPLFATIEEIAMALGRIGTPDAIATLIKFADAHPQSAGVQRAVSRGLALTDKSNRQYLGDRPNIEKAPAIPIESITESMNNADFSVRKSAYESYSLIPGPTSENIFFLLNKLGQVVAPEEKGAIQSALFLLAKRTADQQRSTQQLVSAIPSLSPELQNIAIELLAQIGNEDALRAITACAMTGDDSLSDQATRVLGEWISIDAAPYLLELTNRHPDMKYRIRTFRGYIRLVRQMGSSDDQKAEMAATMIPFVPRENEQQVLDELITHVENSRRDKSLFDGNTLNGWEGNTDIFRVESGAIVGGSMTEPIVQNAFLTSVNRYSDFTLTLECKIIGEGGNAGIQFRSERIPNHNEMIGFQADMTTDGTYWGKLYDEARRNRFLDEVDFKLIESIYKPGEWNRYKIICWGNHIQLYLNDVLTVDYYEQEDYSKTGVIGLQIHSGPPSEASYRNIRIEPYILKY